MQGLGPKLVVNEGLFPGNEVAALLEVTAHY